MQNGNSLIEVLVSIVLLSLLLCGVETLLLRAKHYQKIARDTEHVWVEQLKKSEVSRIFTKNN